VDVNGGYASLKPVMHKNLVLDTRFAIPNKL
jgi:hypothetical protein